MAYLNPEAAALVRAGRAALHPTAVDRARVLAALTSQLGPGVLDGPPSEAPPPDPSAGSRLGQLGWRAWVFAGVPVVGLALGLLLSQRPHTPPPQAAASATPSVSVLEVPAPPPSGDPAPAPPEANAPAPQAAEPTSGERPSRPAAPRPSSARRADALSEEVRLLSNAERDLNRGRAEEALRALSEHERRFPSGALSEERLAARIQALCAAGRRSDGKAQLAQFARTYPRSPHLKRAQEACR